MLWEISYLKPQVEIGIILFNSCIFLSYLCWSKWVGRLYKILVFLHLLYFLICSFAWCVPCVCISTFEIKEGRRILSCVCVCVYYQQLYYLDPVEYTQTLISIPCIRRKISKFIHLFSIMLSECNNCSFKSLFYRGKIEVILLKIQPKNFIFIQK